MTRDYDCVSFLGHGEPPVSAVAAYVKQELLKLTQCGLRAAVLLDDSSTTYAYAASLLAVSRSRKSSTSA